MMSRAKQRAARLLPKNKFARSVSVLAGGTAAGQIIVVAASPVLTRLYSPEDFGLLAVYAGLLGILSVIASLRYQLAIPLPESDEEAATIVVLSLITVGVTTLCTGVAVWLFGDYIVSLLNTPNLLPYLWLIPTSLFLMGVYQVFQYWAIRTKNFPSIAKTKFAQSLSMVVIQVGGYALGPVALLLGRVVGQSVGVLGLARSAFKQRPGNYSFSRLRRIRESANEYMKFPLVSTWAGLSSSAGSQLPPLLLAASLGVGSVGLFSLAQRVLAQPMSIIGKAISDVFYQKAAQAHREGGLAENVQKLFFILLLIGAPPGVAVFVFAPDVFLFVFGSEWHSAGMIARWMVPWMLADFVVSPCTGIYPIINKHGVALRFQIALMMSGIIGVVVGAWYFESLMVSVAIISALKSMVYLSRLVNIFIMLGIRLRAPAIKAMKSVFVCGFIVLPIIALWLYDISDTLLILGCGFVSTVMWLLSVVKYSKSVAII
ncbi:lipopolysaccharide biosynthesis protein [Billgrantia gudaonensis]|uniref:Membrane protein involved in the export of O-antigen and teichoic acid n=1 Tax=Billgrantia gudaonensis TaxID=376427 RepID=A0A1G8QZ52_9GAMM|nr:oligosaccharide flippase family protein [Halomonas gudaonensis]SDJ10014.1 Membrane protein involved in the export of O-antigen and teichoic acid [Halomonas gudaonensis]